MVHDLVHVPLGKEFKAGTFWKNHAEHRVSLLDSPLLSALHRVTVIDTGTLDPIDAGLQSHRIAKFRASVRQDIFKQGEELTSPHTLFQAVKNKAYSPFGTTVHQESKEELFLYKKHSQERLL